MHDTSAFFSYITQYSLSSDHERLSSTDDIFTINESFVRFGEWARKDMYSLSPHGGAVSLFGSR